MNHLSIVYIQLIMLHVCVLDSLVAGVNGCDMHIVHSSGEASGSPGLHCT